jgi:S-adenosylmethionine decarboxylase
VYSAGISYLVELFDCPSTILDDEILIERAIREAARRASATLLHQESRRFEPQGVTAFALLAESHISIHTWPELGYAAVDIFTCGSRAMPQNACSYLATALQAGHHSVRRMDRGIELGKDALRAVAKPVAIDAC